MRNAQQLEERPGVQDREAELAAAYISARPRLIAVAYAVLGSHAEAEDAVSECWLRLSATDQCGRIRDVAAWATVAVARIALDILGSARVRRETYPGPWLPEPIVAAVGEPGQDPAERVTLDDTVSYALLVVLETLTPAERTSWVLHDVFGLSFTDVAEVVGRSPAAVRKLASRARAHIADRAPRVDVRDGEHDAVVARFLSAAAGGDLSSLIAVLDPDVVFTGDGGGEVSAARRPVHGAEKVARLLAAFSDLLKPTEAFRVIRVNGDPGLGLFDSGLFDGGLFDGDALTAVVAFTIHEGLISRIDLVRAPSKLAHVAGRRG